MKVALGITDKNSDTLNPMFARSPYFKLYDIEGEKVTDEVEVENSLSEQTSNAGPSVIEFLAREKVEAIICANMGPKALDLCKQLDIKVYQTNVEKIEEALNLYIQNSLTEIA